MRIAPIQVSFQPDLTVSRGRLHSQVSKGTPVHAGSHVRRGEMVLDSDLLHHPNELVRIFLHEIYHFVWARLGNPQRIVFEGVLRREFELHARGELGWSAEVRKSQLTEEDVRGRSRKWREYACESFCDTAAWLYSGLRRHPEWTLAERYRKWRKHAMTGIIESSGGL